MPFPARYLGIFLTAGLMLGGLCFYYSPEAELKLLERALAGTGARMEEARLTAWADISENPEVFTASRFLEKLEIGAYRLDASLEDGWQLQGELPGGNFCTLAVRGLPSAGESVFTLEARGLYLEGFASLQRTLSVFFAGKGTPLHLEMALHGSLPGILSPEESREAAREALRYSGSRLEESFVSRELVSLTGYSPGFQQYLRAGDRRVNFNVALRVQSSRERVAVHVATPLLSGGY